jgi:hypothetical protein
MDARADGSAEAVPNLRCFPAGDRVFAADAQRLLDAADSPRALQAHLRKLYPRAVVRAQDPMATVRPEVIWYVYRDGNASHRSSCE